jgi:hypothetical protein
MTVDKLIIFTNVLPLLSLTIQSFDHIWKYCDMSILQTKIFFIDLSKIFVLVNKFHIVVSSAAAASMLVIYVKWVAQKQDFMIVCVTFKYLNTIHYIPLVNGFLFKVFPKQFI